MASLDNVIFKMTRAREHFDDLKRHVDAFYLTLEGTRGNPEVPINFGLMAGDCLQNMRSALDYLVYELVVANGSTPNTKHMFPISLNDRDVSHMLRGIAPNAEAIIDALQPYHLASPKQSALYALDELTNLNKHRRPILAQMRGTYDVLTLPFPYMQGIVTSEDARTKAVKKTPIALWIGFDEPPVKGMEVTILLHTMANFLGSEVFPLFKSFF